MITYTTLFELQDILADLYFHTEDVERIAKHVGVPPKDIRLSGNANIAWFDLLNHAHQKHRIKKNNRHCMERKHWEYITRKVR